MAVKSFIDLVENKPAVVLTEAGIELKGKGFYNWSMIASYAFTTDHEGSPYLHLEIEEKKNMVMAVSGFDKSASDFEDLFKKYYTTATVSFPQKSTV